MLKSLSRYKGAIFDLDGTLIDSMHVWDHIDRDWLTAKGIASAAIPFDIEAVLATMTPVESAEYMIRQFNIPLSPGEIIHQWEAMALEQYQKTVPLKPGAAELLRALSDQGVKLAIATSCFPACCEAALDRLDIRKYFSAILYTDEVKRNKTFPDIWLAAASRLGLAPESCAVFEDMYGALRGVRAAGMGFAAVYDGTCADWPAMQAEADLVLRTLTEALDMV
ncbi:beta-phosphoglucomutase [Spirochaetia bacterium]|nr:beta-phosphoglucomutase [Spirochaetia bacterium]